MSSSHDNLYYPALAKALEHANDFLSHLDTEPVDVKLNYEQMKSLWDWDLPKDGKSAEAIIDELDRLAVREANLPA